MDKKEKFFDFIGDFIDIDKAQEDEAIATFNKIMALDDSYYDKIDAYMAKCEDFDEYDYDELMEKLDDILDEIEDNQENELGDEDIEATDEKTSNFRKLFSKQKNDDSNEKEDVLVVDSEEEVEDENNLGDENIEMIEKKPSFFRRLFSRPKEDIFEEDDEDILEEENIPVVEKEQAEEITDSSELGDENIEMIEEKPSFFRRLFSRPKDEDFEEDDEDILEKENIPVVEKEVKAEKQAKKEEKVKKESRIKSFFKKLFAKKVNDIGEEDIPMIEKQEKKGIFTRIFKRTKKSEDEVENTQTKGKKRNNSKFSVIKSFVKKHYPHNSEIKEFIKLINVREDKDVIIDDLYNYIINDKNATKEEEFLNKLYELCGLSKKSEEEIAKEDKKKIEDQNKKDATSKPVRNINKWNEKFLDLKKELFASLGEYEKMFIDDMMAECLTPGDPELDQMFCERKVNKAQIYKYLLNVEKIKILNAYENLTEYEKAFIDDMTEQNITRSDSEYNQMLFERCVNKDIINNYADILEKSKKYQNQIVTDYKKHIVFENASMDLDSKKVSELKDIAKDKDILNISKLNKKQLIEALEKLNQIKLEEADKQLGLKK